MAAMTEFSGIGEGEDVDGREIGMEMVITCIYNLNSYLN